MFDEEVKIKIHSELINTPESFFSEDTDKYSDEDGIPEEWLEERDQVLDMRYIGRFTDDGSRVSIIYKEGVAGGLDNSETVISFLKSEPHIVTMSHEGPVSTLFVFEEGMRYQCVYNTPIMPFDFCIHTERVKNEILSNRRLFLEYVVEIRGATADHTILSLELL